jgi:hypothetical protein
LRAVLSDSAPKEDDFVWLVAYDMFSIPGYLSRGGAAVVAYIDSVTTPATRSPEVQVMRANALFSAQPFNPGSSAPPDTAAQNEALRAYAAVRAKDSTNFPAFLDGAGRLRSKDDALALALAKRAFEIAPRSTNAHRSYWSLIEAQRGTPTTEKRATIAADRAAFLAATDSAPWALDAVSSSMRYTTKESTATIDDRILARFPKSTGRRTSDHRAANGAIRYAARDSSRPAPNPTASSRASGTSAPWRRLWTSRGSLTRRRATARC